MQFFSRQWKVIEGNAKFFFLTWVWDGENRRKFTNRIFGVGHLLALLGGSVVTFLADALDWGTSHIHPLLFGLIAYVLFLFAIAAVLWIVKTIDGWLLQRGQLKGQPKTPLVPPVAVPLGASRNESKRTFSIVASVLVLRDRARFGLVDCEIRNDIEMEKWKKDVAQWFAELNQTIKELFPPEDLAYLEEQENTRKGEFFGYRYRPYNERHENMRNKLWHYTEVLKDIVDKHD